MTKREIKTALKRGGHTKVNTPWGEETAVVLNIINEDDDSYEYSHAISYLTLLTKDAIISGIQYHYHKWEKDENGNPVRTMWRSDIKEITLLADGAYVKGITEDIKAIENK